MLEFNFRDPPNDMWPKKFSCKVRGTEGTYLTNICDPMLCISIVAWWYPFTLAIGVPCGSAPL